MKKKEDRVKKEYICKICGKIIEPMKFSMEEYAYKRSSVHSKTIYYCSYKCMRTALLADEEKKKAKKLTRKKTTAIV